MNNMIDLLTALATNFQNSFNNKNTAGDFNIFKVLGIETKEVILCRFIRELLDPYGVHNLGVTPLAIFLKNILEVNVSEDELMKARIEIKTEDPIDNKRRVDIAIFIDNKVYPIEAKVWAKDQKAQLYDYYNYYKARNEIEKIFYLTPNGKKPSVESKKTLLGNEIKCISFDDIFEWLNNIEPEKTSNLKMSIVQLKEVITEMISDSKKLQQLRELLNIEDVDNYSTNDMLKGAVVLLNNKDKLVREIMQNYLLNMLYIGDDKKYSIVIIGDNNEESTIPHTLLKIVENASDKTLAWICVASNLYIAAKKVKDESKWKKESDQYFWKHLNPNGSNTAFPLKKLECIFESKEKINVERYLEEIIL